MFGDAVWGNLILCDEAALMVQACGGRMFEDGEGCLCEGFGGDRVGELAGLAVADEFRGSADVKAGDGGAAGEGFDDGVGHVVLAGGEEKAVGGGVNQGQEAIIGDGTEWGVVFEAGEGVFGADACEVNGEVLANCFEDVGDEVSAFAVVSGLIGDKEDEGLIGGEVEDLAAECVVAWLKAVEIEGVAKDMDGASAEGAALGGLLGEPRAGGGEAQA